MGILGGRLYEVWEVFWDPKWFVLLYILTSCDIVENRGDG